MTEICLPELGEGIESATIAFLHHQRGDLVKKDEDIVEVVTDKAAFNIPTDAAGTIQEIFVKEGQEIKIGDVLATIHNSD